MQSPEQKSEDENRPTDPSLTSSTGDDSHGSRVDKAVDDIKASGEEKVEHYRGAAADKVDSLGESVRAAASEFDDNGLEEQFSQQLDNLAKGMGTLSSALRDKSGDEILRDVRRIAREHPALFLSGSVALGVAAARFAGASSKSSRNTRSAAEKNHSSAADVAARAKAATGSANGDGKEANGAPPRSGPTQSTSSMANPASTAGAHSPSASDNTENHS